MTQPLSRVENAEREVGRFHDDIEGWKRQHDSLKQVCWPLEDLIAKANFLFNQLTKVDSDIQERILTGQLSFDPAIDAKLQNLFKEWLEASLVVLPIIDAMEQECGVEGTTEFRANVEETRGIVTPDDQFFGGDKLARLEAQAVSEHRAGLTEEWPEDEYGAA